MAAPRFGQVNIVLRDLTAAAEFLSGLGVEMPPAPGWEAHHRAAPTVTAPPSAGGGAVDGSFEVDLDSSVFARYWGGLPPEFCGAVLSLRVEDRSDVDRLYDRAVAIGGRSLAAPSDAFWGARFALVEGPGPLFVGFLSRRDDRYRSDPPDPSTLG